MEDATLPLTHLITAARYRYVMLRILWWLFLGTQATGSSMECLCTATRPLATPLRISNSNLGALCPPIPLIPFLVSHHAEEAQPMAILHDPDLGRYVHQRNIPYLLHVLLTFALQPFPLAYPRAYR